MSTQNPGIRRPLNTHIVRQHLEESAFCWLRRQEARWRPSFRRVHLQRLEHLLDAHLEGLRIAGSAALPLAIHQLQRWKTVDEVFTCTYVLLQQDSEIDWQPLEDTLNEHPHLVDGASAALLLNRRGTTHTCLMRWSQSPVAPLRTSAAAVIAVLLAHEDPAHRTLWVTSQLTDQAASVRAHALRCIGQWRLTGLAPSLTLGAHDED